MQNGAEHFACQVGDRIKFDHGRSHKSPGLRHVALIVEARLAPHRLAMRIEICLRRRIDHRPDMNRRIARITNPQFHRRTLDHGDHLVGNIVLHAQQSQRRAALTCRPERRHHHIICHLLGQGGRIHDHRIDPACFRNQRHNRAILCRKCAVDPPRRLG